MKVNFAMWTGRRTGGTRVLYEIGNELAKRGYKITFTILGKSNAHKWFRFSNTVQFKYVEKGIWDLFNALKVVRKKGGTISLSHI